MSFRRPTATTPPCSSIGLSSGYTGRQRRDQSVGKVGRARGVRCSLLLGVRLFSVPFCSPLRDFIWFGGFVFWLFRVFCRRHRLDLSMDGMEARRFIRPYLSICFRGAGGGHGYNTRPELFVIIEVKYPDAKFMAEAAVEALPRLLPRKTARCVCVYTCMHVCTVELSRDVDQPALGNKIDTTVYFSLFSKHASLKP